MKRTIGLLMIAIFVILSKFSFSQNEGIKKGDQEMTFNGFLYSTTGSETKSTSGNLSVSTGRYLSRHFLVGVGPGLTISKTGSNKTQTDFTLKAFTKVNFTSKKTFIPYLNAQLFTSRLFQDNSQAYVQGGFGFLLFINQYFAWDSQLNYGISVNESSVGLLQLSIGFNYIF